MAPPTQFEHAKSERETIKLTIATLEKTLSDHQSSALDKPTTETFLEMASSTQKELMTNQLALQTTSKNNATDMEPFQQEYPTLLSTAARLSSAFRGIMMSFPASSPSTPRSPSSSSKAHAVDIKLPRLEIPQFSGKLEEWISFRDMFERAVGKNSTISDAQKLTYLKSYLTGEAAKHIESTISDANYDIAWSRLSNRYHNERELLFNILRRLTNQPTSHTASSAGIRGLIDTTQGCIRYLEVLGVPVQHWDAIILFMLFNKLDQTSKELWEQHLPDNKIPNLSSILTFMEQRARALAAGGSTPHPTGHRQFQRKSITVNHVMSTAPDKCILSCNQPHFLYRCPKFTALNVAQRRETIRKYSLCYNCMGSHSVSQCSSKHNCRVCNKRHNSMIHQGSETASGNSSGEQPAQPASVVSSHHVKQHSDLQAATLATARIKVPDADGNPTILRSLLDGGSPVSFITEAAAKRLRLKRNPQVTHLSGIAATPAGCSNATVTILVKPYFNSDVCYSVNAVILEKITSRIPSSKINSSGWDHLQYLMLADPDYANPGHVDVLLGAGVFYEILEMEKRAGPAESPFAIRSTLGWLVAGLQQSTDTIEIFHAQLTLDEKVQRFWEAETIPDTPVFTQEEKECEAHFTATHQRDLNGRFQVSIPWKSATPSIGSSRAQAYRMLLKLEKDFHNPTVRELEKTRKLQQQHQAYVAFMKEYEDMGHMTRITAASPALPSSKIFYIPHHFVEKESSTSTKLRVVYNASMKTSSGFSANNCMMVGPTLQDPLHDILLRFRKHPFAFTADIAKMYRQIRVSPADAASLRILWREHPSQPIDEFMMNTVTYGTASAPYLAVKCLQQLAKYEATNYPVASAIALCDFFVDDLMSGQQTHQEAISTIKELISMCDSAGFPLRKWSSNSQEVLNSIPDDLKETKSIISLDNKEASVKTLGVNWNPSEDVYHFTINLPNKSAGTYTKRVILSEVSMVFDPLGWLSPVIIAAKILLQNIWKSKVQWDEAAPMNLQLQWQELKTSLKQLERITIPRCVFPGDPIKTVLCAFCDSSIVAFSAVLYTVCYYVDQPPQSTLLTSKTKVAPVQAVTLPRLELCGAVLLSRLIKASMSALKHNFDEIRAYTDSMIALAWIQSCPTKWKTYVKHRVQRIQDNTPTAKWIHVPGEDNPADCASRGISPAELVAHPLWWNGNHAMMDPPEEQVISEDVLQPVKNEEQPIKVHLAVPDETLDFITRFSSYSQLQRTVTWLFRFVRNCKLPAVDRQRGPLTVAELQHAENAIISHVQNQVFSTEMNHLQNKKDLPLSSKLLPLTPFIDESGVLRVGGRLGKAKIHKNRRNPILLPHNHHITTILIREYHHKHFHAGPQLLMALTVQKYWILRAKDAIRRETRRCTTCTRYRAETMKQIMGELPADRVNPSTPFSKCGVDYCGPFTTRPPTRSKVTIKSYLAIFVCFATRALHIEVVQLLSTDSFMAALRRFISRRGRPTDMFSDCGTNFVGANKVIKELYSSVASAKHNEDVANACSKEGIQWHFNPPNSPHFGGLWEAGVRSVKYHLQRVMGSTHYTYEELLTLVTQIEALLNTRPLIPASSDPADLKALTPAHFLHGEPTTALPEPDYTQIKEGRLDHWQKIQQQKQIFWRRWSSEYISRLQQRPKWMKQSPQIQHHDLVIMKDDNLPPARWHLGRVMELHPGSDGITRVVTLKTAYGTFKRAIHRLCLLPIEKASVNE